jgi:hypothetical protein
MILSQTKDSVGAAAIVPTPLSSTQFDITGFLQSASLDQACVAAAGTSLDGQGHPQAAHCAGTMMLNGHTVVVPAETVVIQPASALTWQELFAQSPSPYTGVATGSALNDSPTPATTYEFQAVGNRVIGGGQDRPRFESLDRRLTVEAPTTLEVIAGAGAVGQAVEILIDNALWQGRGDVHVVVRHVEGGTEIEIRDEGSIYHIDPGDTRRSPSHGLGLVVARSLLRGDGGAVDLTHSTPTTFVIRLSLTPPSQDPSSLTLSQRDPHSRSTAE